VNFVAARAVADAVMYEGYILYPYRASAPKNRSRWQFGVVMAPGYTAVDPSERDFAQTECVLEHSAQTTVAVVIRFLQVQRRTSDGSSWDEAVEHEHLIRADAARLLDGGHVTEFEIPAGEDREGDVVRRREHLTASVSVLATPLPGPWGAVRLRVRVDNRSASATAPRTREDALPTALVAAHMIIGLDDGAFISMTDPPEWASAEVQACENIGCWPVLAGADGGREVMLSTPIILYDHPELAPESPGDLYDGTEIDEILSLRTLALSDAEKQEARATDPRAAALIDRVEALGPDDFNRMHGAIRSPRVVSGPAGAGHGPDVGRAQGVGRGPGAGSVEPPGYEPDVPWWDPAADASVSPDTDAITVAGRRIARGSLVTLRPGVRRSDAQDMFLDGRPARVEAVLLDVDDTAYLAVSLTDDPDQDLRVAHGRFLYFSPDEVEPCETP
jgi:hypothetical protein